MISEKDRRRNFKMLLGGSAIFCGIFLLIAVSVPMGWVTIYSIAAAIGGVTVAFAAGEEMMNGPARRDLEKRRIEAERMREAYWAERGDYRNCFNWIAEDEDNPEVYAPCISHRYEEPITRRYIDPEYGEIEYEEYATPQWEPQIEPYQPIVPAWEQPVQPSPPLPRYPQIDPIPEEPAQPERGEQDKEPIVVPNWPIRQPAPSTVDAQHKRNGVG